MKIVLDTNVLLVSLSRRAKTRWIFDRFLNGEITLCVTTAILNEYAEIVGREIGREAADNLMQILDEAENVLFIHRYFRWNLIFEDPDDNKFVDCAVACDAKFIVSEDRHFRVLQQIPFPKISVVGIDDFKKQFENQ